MTTWLSLSQFMALPLEQRTDPRYGIDLTIDERPGAERRAQDIDYRDERRHGWGLA